MALLSLDAQNNTALQSTWPWCCASNQMLVSETEWHIPPEKGEACKKTSLLQLSHSRVSGIQFWEENNLIIQYSARRSPGERPRTKESLGFYSLTIHIPIAVVILGPGSCDVLWLLQIPRYSQPRRGHLGQVKGQCPFPATCQGIWPFPHSWHNLQVPPQLPLEPWGFHSEGRRAPACSWAALAQDTSSPGSLQGWHLPHPQSFTFFCPFLP